MAVKTDLTFEELNDQFDGLAITFSGGDIVISVSAVTGDTYTALTDEGVLEFLYKLRAAMGEAQETANVSLVEGEFLDSFPAFSFSPPANGFVTVTQSHTVRIPLNTGTVVGTNV